MNKNKFLATAEYDRQKKTKSTAIALQLFGLGRLYVGSYGRRLFFVIIYATIPTVGIIRHIVDFFLINNMIDQYNKALKLEINVKYDLLD